MLGYIKPDVRLDCGVLAMTIGYSLTRSRGSLQTAVGLSCRCRKKKDPLEQVSDGSAPRRVWGDGCDEGPVERPFRKQSILNLQIVEYLTGGSSPLDVVMRTRVQRECRMSIGTIATGEKLAFRTSAGGQPHALSTDRWMPIERGVRFVLRWREWTE